MPRIRRVTAVIAHLLLIELSIVSGGAACPLSNRSVATTGTQANHEHVMSSAGQSSATPREGQAPAEDGHRRHSSGHCDLPCTPAGCVGGAMCWTTAEATPPSSVARGTGRRAAATSSTQPPVTRDAAPATPPPRA